LRWSFRKTFGTHTYNKRILPFMRAEVVEIETFVEIKNICGGIETSVQRNPAKKTTSLVIFR